MSDSQSAGVLGADGYTRWRDADGEFHCDDGPAFISPSGDQRWYRHGQRHRIDGPAVIYGTGTLGRMWLVNGVAVLDDVDVLDDLYAVGDITTLAHILSSWTPGGPSPAALLDAVRGACA